MTDTDDTAEHADRVEFGRFEVDFAARTITCHGEAVAVEPQVFDVLEVLVRNRERVVPKLEILDRVWGDRFVSPATLTSRIRDLRAALGDSGQTQHTIKTAHGRGFQFVAEITELDRRRPAPAVGATHPAFPPPLRPLLGRAGELADVHHRLDRERLVTLVGAGGAGKTHLMRHTTAGIDAVVCELADVRDPGGLARTALDAAGGTERADIDTTSALIDVLAPLQRLVVFDNCEHVIDQVIELVRRILAECPGVTVLATSRRPLLLADEYVVRLGPLDEEAAAELLVGHAARHAVDLDPHDPTDATICQRLDRMPLALELAASKARVLPLDRLATMLDERISVLTADHADAPDHHRSLEAAIAWSYELLTPSQQTLLVQLSVIVGPFDLDTALAVCGSGDDAADLLTDLTALTDLSLLTFEPSTGRYHLTEAIRLFAEQQGLDDATRARHLRHVVAAAEAAYPMVATTVAAQLAATRALWPNVRAARAFAHASDDAESVHRLIRAVSRFAEQTYAFEVLDWCDDAIARDEAACRATPPETHLVAALLRTHRGEHQDAARSLAHARDAADPAASALADLWWSYSVGDIDAADRCAETVRTHERGLGSYSEIVGLLFAQFLDRGANRPFDPRDVERLQAITRNCDEIVAVGMDLCDVLRLDWERDTARAIERVDAVIDEARRHGLAFLLGGASTVRSIAFAANPAAAASAEGLREALRSHADTGAWQFALADFGGIALALVRCGHADIGAELLGTRQARGYLGDVSGAVAREAEQEARAALGSDGLAEAMARGADHTPETAARRAIDALTSLIGD